MYVYILVSTELYNQHLISVIIVFIWICLNNWFPNYSWSMYIISNDDNNFYASIFVTTIFHCQNYTIHQYSVQSVITITMLMKLITTNRLLFNRILSLNYCHLINSYFLEHFKYYILLWQYCCSYKIQGVCLQGIIHILDICFFFPCWWKLRIQQRKMFLPVFREM